MFPTPTTNLLPPFGVTITPEAVQASTEPYPADYVITTILELSSYLISLVDQSTLFDSCSHNPFSPSLRTLNDRLHNGHLAPSPLQTHANQEQRAREALNQRTAKAAMNRPLEDFEDLYYAVISRMLDIHQLLNARLGSGFSNLIDLVLPDGPTIASLYESLAQYWDLLNTAGYVKAFDDAVRRSRVKHLHQEILLQVQHDEITQADAEELLADLYDPSEYEGVQGLAWIGSWAPSMIGAWLEERYHITFNMEREAEVVKTNAERRKTRINKTKQKTKQARAQKSQKRNTRVFSEQQEPNASLNDMSMHGDIEGGEIQAQRQGHELQGQLHQASEWQMKAQRVERYTQYLRDMASQNAKRMVQSTVISSDLYVGTFGDTGGQTLNKDMEMTDSGF
jgi:hypothetical protein